MNAVHRLTPLSPFLLLTGSRAVYRLTNTPANLFQTVTQQTVTGKYRLTNTLTKLCQKIDGGAHRLTNTHIKLFQTPSQQTSSHRPHVSRTLSVCTSCVLTSFSSVARHTPLQTQKAFLHQGRRGVQWTSVRGGDALWVQRVFRRPASSKVNQSDRYHRRTGLIYVCAAGIFMLGMSYAGVPLYRMFCQATGLGGMATRGHDTSKIETMQSVKERVIKVRFNADVASSMRWNFKPQQTEVKVVPGETALAFYTAKNPTDKPIIGISTYNVVPFDAGQYFNKIQCFCFEEQRLNPHEQVDMPVFFYLDPEFAEDPKLAGVDCITLSYTFFEAKDGFQLPLPGYMTQAS